MPAIAAIGWPVIDRIALGPLAVSPHGLGIALGYLSGSWWMLRQGKKRGLSEDDMGTILLWALVGAIVGARFFYVVGHFSEFESFTDMLAIWRGGISLVGGIFGAIIFAYPWMRRFGYRFLQVMDSAAVGLAFGIIIGRIGDLIIGDHLGKPTTFFLGFRYSGGELPGYSCSGEGTRQTCFSTTQTIEYGDVIHQTALYDFFIALGLFLFLLWLSRKPRREGVMIMTFAIWYGTGRIITDFLRVDKLWFGLTGSQWAAVAVIVISLLALLRYALRPLREVPAPGDEPGPIPEPVTAPVPRHAAAPVPEEAAAKDTSPPLAHDHSTTAFTPPAEPEEAPPPADPWVTTPRTDPWGSPPPAEPEEAPPPADPWGTPPSPEPDPLSPEPEEAPPPAEPEEAPPPADPWGTPPSPEPDPLPPEPEDARPSPDPWGTPPSPEPDPLSPEPEEAPPSTDPEEAPPPPEPGPPPPSSPPGDDEERPPAHPGTGS